MLQHSTAVLLLLGLASSPIHAEDFASDSRPVGITSQLQQVRIIHQGKPVVIRRNPDNAHTVDENFAKTSRPCPPFCIQPMQLAPGVETIAELEMLNYLKQRSDGDDSLLIIDSRTEEWLALGTIPGSISIPWTKLNLNRGSDPITLLEILEQQFNVKQNNDFFDFSKAKTLVLFCNGMWCGQSPTNIKTLLGLGYPSHKLKWYRGGMQNWHNLGFTTIKP